MAEYGSVEGKQRKAGKSGGERIRRCNTHARHFSATE